MPIYSDVGRRVPNQPPPLNIKYIFYPNWMAVGVIMSDVASKEKVNIMFI